MPYGIVSLMIHPAPGDTVATSVRPSGAVVIEFRFSADAAVTTVHVEGYAAGVGPYSGDEWELSDELHFEALFPRRRGFQLLTELEDDLRAFGNPPNPKSITGPS